VQAAVESLGASVEAHRFSVDALAGTVIQVAKQGLALVHGSKPTATGRMVGSSQQLSEVIWQARNQALHWEDRSFNAAVNKCFTSLASEVDQVFSEYVTRNMALDVIKMLGWHTSGVGIAAPPFASGRQLRGSGCARSYGSSPTTGSAERPLSFRQNAHKVIGSSLTMISADRPHWTAIRVLAGSS
jgi:hypothetical protein